MEVDEKNLSGVRQQQQRHLAAAKTLIRESDSAICVPAFGYYK